MKRMILRVISLIALSMLVFGGREALAQEFKYRVEHDHTIGSCKGELVINQQGVEYRTENKKHARKWTYADIEMIELRSPRKLEVLTYESALVKLGRDRTFEFKLLDGGVTKEVSEFLLGRVEGPLSTTFVASEEKPQYAIPVRHRHSFGGCQGTLKVYADRVVYESPKKQESSRYWRWSDINSFSRIGRYELSITTFEPKLGGPTKTFNFDLKEQVNDAMYDYLWARVYRPTLPASPDDKRDGQRIQR
jgi:hypothetical protein